MEKQTTLYDLRRENNKSRSEVAAALGVSANAITNYETGIRSINLEQVLQLAHLYECSAEIIISAQLASIQIGKS